MSETPAAGGALERRVTRAGPLTLLGGGRTAFREVPGLRRLMLQGFLLLYGLFAVIGTVALGLVYTFVVSPLSQNLSSWQGDGGFFVQVFVPLASGLLWLGQVLLLAATLLLSFVLSLTLLSVWFEALAGRIVAHVRGGENALPFSMGRWLGSLGRALKDNLRLLLLAVLALAVGFVPLVGPLLVFALSSYIMGWEVREPYLAVRVAAGDDIRALRRGLTGWTLRAGTLAVLLAMVPWLGWLLLPMLLIYQVAGVAWLSENDSG